MLGKTVINGYHWLTQPYQFLDAQLHERGLTFQLDLPVLGHCLVTGDSDLVREIALHPDLDSGRGIFALRSILGERSLITLDGQEHRDRRRRLAPAFSSRMIHEYDELTIESARAVIDSFGSRPFSVYEAARRISLKAIVRFIFGESTPDAEQSMELLVDDFLRSFQNPLVLYLKFLQIDLGPLSPWGRALRNRDRLRARILAEIAQRRKQKGAPGGLLGALVEGSDVPDDDLATEILTLLMFGHDTAAAAMAWVMAHLLQHPEAMEQARIECEGIQALEAPEQNRYLKACIQESMRLCPVVVNLTRIARRDLEIGGYRIRPGERVLPCAYLAHHNEDVFPNAYSFSPERFLGGSNHKHAYFPFGIGERVCIGENFAMRQMMLVVSTFITQASLELLPRYRAQPARNLVLIMPSGGTQVVNRALAAARTASPGAANTVPRAAERLRQP